MSLLREDTTVILALIKIFDHDLYLFATMPYQHSNRK